VVNSVESSARIKFGQRPRSGISNRASADQSKLAQVAIRRIWLGFTSTAPASPWQQRQRQVIGMFQIRCNEHRTKRCCRRDARGRGSAKGHRANSHGECGLARQSGIPTCAANGYLCAARSTLIFADEKAVPRFAFRHLDPRIDCLRQFGQVSC
jgi:hypothetical protein